MTLTRDIWHHRANTAAELASIDPLLADRELCLEVDTRRCKLGPGQWSELDYVVGQVDQWGVARLGRRSFTRWHRASGGITLVGQSNSPNWAHDLNTNPDATAHGYYFPAFTPGAALLVGGFCGGSTSRRWHPTLCMRWRMPTTLADQVLWFGLLSGIINVGTSDQSDKQLMAVRHIAGDSNFSVVACNGSGQLVFATDVAASSGGYYTAVLDCPPGSDELVVYLGGPQIEDVSEVARVSRGLPSASVSLGPCAFGTSPTFYATPTGFWFGMSTLTQD